MIDKCFYCGKECGSEYKKKEFVKKTFTNYDIIKNPVSRKKHIGYNPHVH